MASNVHTNVARVLPLEADLKVVVPVDKVKEPSKQLGTLLVSDTIDMLDMAADRENALPPGDRISTHNGMHCLELGPHVFRCTARFVVEGEARLLGNLLETRLLECHGETLEEFLVRFADTVIELITRGPECICRDR